MQKRRTADVECWWRLTEKYQHDIIDDSYYGNDLFEWQKIE